MLLANATAIYKPLNPSLPQPFPHTPSGTPIGCGRTDASGSIFGASPLCSHARTRAHAIENNTHACTYPPTHPHTHTPTSYTHASTAAHACASAHTLTVTCTRARTRACARMRARMRGHIRARAHARAQARGKLGTHARFEDPRSSLALPRNGRPRLAAATVRTTLGPAAPNL
jgi:hypothetical protein